MCGAIPVMSASFITKPSGKLGLAKKMRNEVQVGIHILQCVMLSAGVCNQDSWDIDTLRVGRILKKDCCMHLNQILIYLNQ